jgi:hypothetical protein
MSKATIYYYTAQERTMALDSKRGRGARDAEPDDADGAGVMLDKNTIAEMLDHHAKGVAMYSKVLADMKENDDSDAEAKDDGEQEPVEPLRKSDGESDSRGGGMSFDERFPELANVRVLGGGIPLAKRARTV